MVAECGRDPAEQLAGSVLRELLPCFWATRLDPTTTGRALGAGTRPITA